MARADAVLAFPTRRGWRKFYAGDRYIADAELARRERARQVTP